VAKLKGDQAEAAAVEETSGRRGKGERTRRRIMDATAQLLKVRPYGDIRITDVARVAEIAQPNFYAYFSSLEAVYLALARELNVDPLVEFVEPEWKGEAGLALARRLAQAAIDFWRARAQIFAILNVMSDERHGEFAAIRARVTRNLYKAFEAKIREAQAKGRLSKSIEPRLAGYECITILTSSGIRYDLFRASGFTHEQLVETHAQIIHRLLGAE
jgi:AcrR family transcriptional regulator